MEIFDWNKIEHKNEKTTGSAKLKCPQCNHTRKNKADKSLYVRYDSGVAKCFNCEGLSFRDSVQKETEQKYTLPSQEWKNYTKLSDAVVKYFEGRKIQQYVLNEMRITEELHYQPAMQKKVNNIVFNFFEGDVLVNKKYRSGNKKFTQSKDAKSIFYNINSVIGKDECYIVEGEMDALSLVQIGVKNVLSVPNGANDNDVYWSTAEKYLTSVKRYFIAVDNDEKGNELAERIAQRLGRYRCERVNFEGKDANEDLISGVLEKTIKNTSRYPVSGTFGVMDMYDDIINLYDNGLPPVYSPKHHCFGNLSNIFTVMRGHLIVSTGIPSHGKSNFTEWYVMNLVNDFDMKASFFSPEHLPMQMHQTTFIQKFCGKNFWSEIQGTPRLDKIDIAKYSEWANEKIYLTSPNEGSVARWDWLIEKMHEQMFSHGVDVFVIDAYNKVEHTENRSERELISRVLNKLTSFASANNVMVFLVAHPTKMQKNETGIYKIPDLYDVSGSADFRNQPHDGYCIYRYFEDNNGGENYTSFYNLKTKMSFQGKIGANVDFDYHLPSGRYYARGSEPPTHYLYEKKQEVKNVPLVEPNDAFDDKAPF